MLFQERLVSMSLASYLFVGAITLSPRDVGINPVSVTGDTLGNALGLVYFIAGIVCVIVIIVGGIRYTTSGGDSSGLTSAKNTIVYALVGLLFVLMAAAITQLIFKTL